MTTLQLRNRIQEQLAKTKDEQLLNTIYEMLTAADDEVVQLTPEHRASVMRGLEQMRNGEVCSEEEADREIEEWLREK